MNTARILPVVKFAYLSLQKTKMEIEASPESIYKLLQVMDRGALKWPSGIVINILVTLVGNSQLDRTTTQLFKEFIEGPSRQIIVNIKST